MHPNSLANLRPYGPGHPPPPRRRPPTFYDDLRPLLEHIQDRRQREAVRLRLIERVLPVDAARRLRCTTSDATALYVAGLADIRAALLESSACHA